VGGLTPDVTICVATFGDQQWRHTAHDTALRSAETLGVPVVAVHGTTIHGARNACLSQVQTEFVIYIDGDDLLEPGYLDAMAASSADVRVPRVRYVTDTSRPLPAPGMPRVVGHHHPHPCTQECLPCGNWIVIGAQVRTQFLRDIGGWRDYGWEDWDLWLRCHLAGARVEPVPDAIYRANVHPGSRGRYGLEESLRHHIAVAEANGFDLHGNPLSAKAGC
jgi:glycosyltransferase involved in cell wall biosynthesis